MAQKYRTFKRLSMTPVTARRVVELLVDRTLNDHAEKCLKTSLSGQICIHAESGTLAVARLVEANIVIGKRRARLDIPDDPALALRLSERLLGFCTMASNAGIAFRRLGNDAHAWATRSPLERLAEAGLELD